MKSIVLKTGTQHRCYATHGRNSDGTGPGRRRRVERTRPLILAQLTSDIGGDPSEAQGIIIRRATQLAVWCEQAEAEAAGGKTLNIAEYATATNTLRRLLLDLGLERRMRDITPRIDAYLARS